MIGLNKKQAGFTFVELVIVVVVLGILAAIVIAAHSGIQANERNDTRKTDLLAIRDALVGFDGNNGYYPSLADMNNPVWRTKNLPNFSSADMVDPSSKETSADAQLAATPGPKVYSYQVTDANGNSCETDDTNCAKYVLTATYEGKEDNSKTYTLISPN